LYSKLDKFYLILFFNFTEIHLSIFKLPASEMIALEAPARQLYMHGATLTHGVKQLSKV